MLKRVLVILAMGAALVACSPSGSTSTTSTETVAPVQSTTSSEAPSLAPSDSGMEASPSAS